jgi:hypothetical protein
VSRSSAREGRGQAEPLAALVAVAAVGVGLSVYAGALDASTPAPVDRTPETVLAAVHDAVAPDGTVLPDRLDRGLAAVPDGRMANVTLATDDRTWRAGPAPPSGAEAARRRVPVERTAGVDAGRLRVVVWS